MKNSVIQPSPPPFVDNAIKYYHILFLHCHHDLYQTKFKLETDHKPLVQLLSTKDLAELPARIQRFKMRLMRFDFSISHVAGKDLNIADTLSRAPVENMSQSDTDFENETEAFVDVVMSNLPASQNRIELIKTESAKDEICRNLISYCRDGWPEKSKLDEELPRIGPCRENLLYMIIYCSKIQE